MVNYEGAYIKGEPPQKKSCSGWKYKRIWGLRGNPVNQDTIISCLILRVILKYFCKIQSPIIW